ncbi:hypothetical protein OEZ85_011111 [Tetradesmus obliquus]|uniref:Uncharacterized protein n=1 Tax=Tetradesmus obliquus TaxID=3088 RepID=A0ABY8TPA3_TETOB|nr:hypothetical protein OEZ85_011111 [Tetradesmus obliquus]
MQQTLNLHWAYVPAGSNADLMRAVTHAPTQIGVRADGWAWQYYKAGVVPCNADAIYPYTTRWGEQGFIRVQRNCTKSSKAPYGPFVMLGEKPIMPVLTK